MAKKSGPTYEELARQIKAGDFRPIYYLMGDEPYYINLLSDLIVEKALKEEERDFNLTILYGEHGEASEISLCTYEVGILPIPCADTLKACGVGGGIDGELLTFRMVSTSVSGAKLDSQRGLTYS